MATPRRSRLALAHLCCTALVLLTACSSDESPTSPSAPLAPIDGEPASLIDDGAHNGLVGFYWYLPTLRPSPPKTLTPDPDLAGLDPLVTIRLCSNDNCTSVGATVAQFSRTSTPAAITYNNGGKQYQVSWKTSTSTAGT